jgi:hypothetical protein
MLLAKLSSRWSHAGERQDLVATEGPGSVGNFPQSPGPSSTAVATSWPVDLQVHAVVVDLDCHGASPPGGEARRTVTSAVTTRPDSARSRQRVPDNTRALTCENQTQCDAVRRNRRQWHARGLGFEFP